MSKDRKVLYTISLVLVAVLFPALFIPRVYIRIIAAALSAAAAVSVSLIIKKRSILSIDKRQILLIMSVMGVLYLVIYYLTGLEFGFYKAKVPFSTANFFKFILPIAVIIISIEVIRSILLAQKNKLSTVTSYVVGVISEIMIGAGFAGSINHARFMDIVAMIIFPAVTANILYHYISVRYGMSPNIAYRLIISLYSYVLPVYPSMPDSLFSFANILVPLVIQTFIAALYTNKNRRYAVKSEKGKWYRYIVTAIVIIIMISIVMLISCQFRYRTVVIATESMTGELNKGDAIVYEEYDEQIIKEGQVIVFIKDGQRIVHRVEEIQRINGRNRYFTKGDANDARDAGYITDGHIEGVVLFKVSYVGYPSIWMRSLFK